MNNFDEDVKNIAVSRIEEKDAQLFHENGQCESFDKNLKRRSSFEVAILPWDLFSNWVHCICVVTFDLEIGQALEVIYPSHASLTATEKMNICYLSFPDSNSGCMGDTRFHFRMRRFFGRSINSAHKNYNYRAPSALQIDTLHYYGFVFFRQTKNRVMPRGYLQKVVKSGQKKDSVVLITLLPFVNLFSHVIEIISPRFFEFGESSLEAACHDMDQWPAPEPGLTFNLPLMGTLIQCRIPSRFDLPNYHKSILTDKEKKTPIPLLLPTVHEPNLFENLAPILFHLQFLWELVLIGQALMEGGIVKIC